MPLIYMLPHPVEQGCAGAAGGGHGAQDQRRRQGAAQ